MDGKERLQKIIDDWKYGKEHEGDPLSALMAEDIEWLIKQTTLGEYLKCELRLNSGEETITKLNLRYLPRVGEHISTVLEHDKQTHDFLIKEIWHWAKEHESDHKIIIYVQHA